MVSSGITGSQQQHVVALNAVELYNLSESSDICIYLVSIVALWVCISLFYCSLQLHLIIYGTILHSVGLRLGIYQITMASDHIASKSFKVQRSKGSLQINNWKDN